MYTVGGVAATFGAAALGSLVYLVQRQRPCHRPFGRRGWRYTIVAMAWVAAVTTVVVYLLTVLSSGAVPSPVLAFAAPIGAGGIRAVSQRSRGGESISAQPGDSGPLPQLLALGLPLVLDWLDQHLADLKQQQIDFWHARVRTDRARRTLIRSFHARLAERSLPGTSRVVRRLHERGEIYTELYEQSLSCDAHAKRRLKVEIDVAVDDILRLVYEARADALIKNRPSATSADARDTSRRPRVPEGIGVEAIRRRTSARSRRRAAPN